jgi:hypothetical protein
MFSYITQNNNGGFSNIDNPGIDGRSEWLFATPTFREFDYAIVRYKWDSLSGTDLDTRTGLINTGTSYDSQRVGFCYDSIIYNQLATAYYIEWGGDNTSDTGPEACLIDFSVISTDFPLLSQIEIKLSAVWYGQRFSGDVILEFETYLGGVMTPSGLDFINVGGVLKNSIQVSGNVVADTTSCIEGDCIQTLIYDVGSKTANLSACL